MTPTAPNRILVGLGKLCVVLSAVLIVGFIVAFICSELGTHEELYRDNAAKLCMSITGWKLNGGPDLSKDKRDNFIAWCTEKLSDAWQPCIAEYKYGTDSALQCQNRYTGSGSPVLNEVLKMILSLKQDR